MLSAISFLSFAILLLFNYNISDNTITHRLADYRVSVSKEDAKVVTNIETERERRKVKEWVCVNSELQQHVHDIITNCNFGIFFQSCAYSFLLTHVLC